MARSPWPRGPALAPGALAPGACAGARPQSSVVAMPRAPRSHAAPRAFFSSTKVATGTSSGQSGLIRRVWPVQARPGVNLLPAAVYGRVQPAALPAHAQATFNEGCDATLRRLRYALGAFAEEDYLLLLGDPVAIGLAVLVTSEATNGRFALLKWDRQERVYFPIYVDTHHKKGFHGKEGSGPA